MKIANEFTVHAPIEQAWAVLTDLEQVVPLVPGAEMIGWEGDDFVGKIKVKVGPVTSEFKGKAQFVDRDEVNHRATISGKAREARGSGNASATVVTELHQDGASTRVNVDTELKIVGKLAQFGSGMLQQVSEKLIGQFVDALEAELAADAAGATDAAPVAPKVSEPLDLIDLAGPAIGKRVAAVVVMALTAVVVFVLVRRRR